MTGDVASSLSALLGQTRGNPQQWVQLVMVLLVIGGSFISWLFKQLQAKAEQKRRMDALERRKLEALRTGRDVGEVVPPGPAPAEPPSTERQRELAARRQAQLQELRRRQVERARQGAGTPPPPPAEPTRQTPLVIIPGSTGPIVVERAPAQRRPPREIARPTGRPEARQAPREAPRHPASMGAPQQATARPPERAKRAKGQRARPQPEPSQSIEREQFTHISQAAPALQVSKVSQAGPVMVGVPQTPEDWRRALIAREILGRPLAERPPGDPWQIPVV